MAPTKHHGMAKNKVLQAKPVVAKPHKIHMDLQDPLECPLCIEQLDNTDRDFFPCPCGYQVCLFCYQRLQNEYNNTCPGCRQQYGQDLDAVRQHIECKQKQQALEAVSRPAVSSSSSHVTPGHCHGHLEYGPVHGLACSLGQHHGQHHAVHGHANHSGHGHAGHRPKTLVPPPPAAARPRQHHEPAPHPRPGELQGTGLPPNANWVNAAAAAGNTSSVDSTDMSLPQPTADDDSWPSLEVAANTNNQQQQQQQHKQQLVRRQSSSSSETSMHSQQQQQQAPSSRHDASRSSMDSTVSSLTNPAEVQSSQQQDQRPQQQLESRSSSGFTAVEVTTVVGGARHSVCVPISNHSEVSPFPEAATLLEILQQAVDGNKLSSTEAAVQLVQCLRKLEADSSQKQQRAWLDQALAAGRNGAVRTATAAAAAATGGRVAAGKDTPPIAPSSTRAPPPGFSSHPRANGVYAPQLRQQQQGQTADGGNTAAAAARSMPHRSVSSVEQHLSGRHGDNYASQSSMHSVDSDSSLFSQGSSLSQSAGLWTDAGLPGVDFSAGLGSGLRSSIPAVPPRLQMLWAGSNGMSSSQTNGVTAAATSGYTTPSVPPGFAGSNGLGLASTRFGSSNTSRLLNGSYNPLSYADPGARNSQQSTLAVPPGFGGLSELSVAAAAQKQEQPLYRPWG